MISAVLLTGCASSYQEYSIDLSDTAGSTESPAEETLTESISTDDAEPSESETPTETETEPETFDGYSDDNYVEYYFRSDHLLDQHFEKHGDEFSDGFGYETAEEYEQGASDVINDPDALFKTEAEDGDGVYYLEDTNEFVILSTDGYIRTYFRPDAGIDYFNRQ